MPTGKLTQTQNLTGGINTGNHKTLMNRDAADQHPMSAITGLLDALNSDTDKISAVEEKIDSEANRAIQNEQQLAIAIKETAKEAKILVDTEKVRAEKIENSIVADIANVRTEIKAGDAAVTKLVEQETSRAETKEAEIEKIAKEALESTEHFDDIIFPLKKAIADETENRIKRDNDIISDFTAKNYQVNKRIEQEIIDRTQADNDLQEQINNISIEELSKRTTYRTFLPENPSKNDRFVLVSEYTEGLNYYKHLEQENTNYKMKFVPATVTAETFEPNTYYYYDENFNQEFIKTDVVKSSGYYPAYEFNSEDTYYEQVYDADDTNLFGMWELPLVPNYIGDWPDWAFGWLNDTPGYFYRDDGQKTYFERTGALRFAYYMGDNSERNPECWGFAVGNGWNGSYGIHEKGRYIYPDKAGAGMGAGWAMGFDDWDQPDAKRILYYTDNNPAFADGFKATGAVKVSDALLPFGDYNYKTKYVQVEVDRNTFEPGKYYTYFNKETGKQNEVNFMINTKNYVENIPYYEVTYMDKVSNEPVYQKITLTESEFYAGLQNHNYYRLVILTAQPEEYTVTRIQLDSDKSIYRDVLGNNLVEITDDNVIVGGENLIPNLTINRDKVTTVTLENNAETVFEKPIENLIIEIPDNLKHGFCSFISFETAKADVSVSFNTVYANKPLKFIFSGATIAEEDLDFATETQYNLMFLCNGIYLEVYIQEIQLI